MYQIKIKTILLFLMVGLFLSACGSDRAGANDLNEKNRSNGVLGVLKVIVMEMD